MKENKTTDNTHIILLAAGAAVLLILLFVAIVTRPTIDQAQMDRVEQYIEEAREEALVRGDKEEDLRVCGPGKSQARECFLREGYIKTCRSKQTCVSEERAPRARCNGNGCDGATWYLAEEAK